MSADYDSPWKEALDRWFQPFIAFFFPLTHADIDWSRGYETLDTELQQVVRDAELGRRYADKLVKVWLRDGSEEWLLIHVEVQGRREEDFARAFTSTTIASSIGTMQKSSAWSSWPTMTRLAAARLSLRPLGWRDGQSLRAGQAPALCRSRGRAGGG